MEIKDYKLAIAANLRRYRTLCKMTQKELADHLNGRTGLDLRSNTISSWENAVNSIQHDYMPILADILGVSLEQLYGQETVEKPVPEALKDLPFDELDERDMQRVRHYVEFLIWEKTSDN